MFSIAHDGAFAIPDTGLPGVKGTVKVLFVQTHVVLFAIGKLHRVKNVASVSEGASSNVTSWTSWDFTGVSVSRTMNQSGLHHSFIFIISLTSLLQRVTTDLQITIV